MGFEWCNICANQVMKMLPLDDWDTLNGCQIKKPFNLKATKIYVLILSSSVAMRLSIIFSDPRIASRYDKSAL